MVGEEELPKIEFVPKLCCTSSYFGASGKRGWGIYARTNRHAGITPAGPGGGGTEVAAGPI